MGTKQYYESEPRCDKANAVVEPSILEIAIGCAPIGVLSLDHHGKITVAKGRTLAALGITQSELVGHSIFDVLRDSFQVAEALRDALAGKAPTKFVIRIESMDCEVSISTIYADAGTPSGAVMILSDVSEWLSIERELKSKALYDPTTKLPNRNYLIEEMGGLTAAAVTDPFAVIALGIDQFRDVNSTFGFAFGDKALRSIGLELQEAYGGDACVSRIGGDEFAVVMSVPKAQSLVANAVDKAITVFESPFVVAENSLRLEATMGVAIYPGHGSDPEHLLRKAVAAMRFAKDNRLPYALYKEERDTSKINNVELLSDLRAALENDELFLEYQPKICFESGDLAGVEALLRWAHPERGVVLPGTFIPLAERTGVIAPITQWVANAAAKQLKEWNNAGRRIPIAVNLSSRTFQSERLVDEICALVEVWGVDASQIELEITETAVMHDPKRAVGVCRVLSELGISIVVDDFGVGHSPLVYLKDLHVAHVKIDRCFIKDIKTDKASAVIVESVIYMAKRLGIQTIAEGIEDQETFNLLRDMGCDQAQGFFICRPTTPDKIVEWPNRVLN